MQDARGWNLTHRRCERALRVTNWSGHQCPSQLLSMRPSVVDTQQIQSLDNAAPNLTGAGRVGQFERDDASLRLDAVS